MIRAVIFDLGNTLMYFNGDWDEVRERGLKALTRYLHANGIHVNSDFGTAFVKTRQEGRERSAQTDVEYTATLALRDTLAGFGYTDVQAGIIARGLELFFAPEEEHWVPYTDARETVEQLRARGLHVGLISNATDDGFIQRLTQRAGLHELMNPVLSSAAMPWRKPDARIFNYVLDEWRLDATAVVMVGDWPSTDILGAHRAGLRAVLIEERWPEPPHLDQEIADMELLEADAVVRELGELIPALEQLMQTSTNLSSTRSDSL